MPSLSAVLLRAQLKLIVKPFAKLTGIEGSRKAQARLGDLGATANAGEVNFSYVRFSRFSACFATPKKCIEPRKRVVLYLHGGGYTAGDLSYAKGFGSVIAKHSLLRVFCVAYRLAPENPYPAAVNDALEAYEYLLELGYRPEQIAFAGESAGGGLIYALALKLKELGRKQPCCMVALSPWTDLTLSGESMNVNSSFDPTLSREQLEGYATLYALGHESEPLASPLFGELSNLAHSLIIVGGDEVLLSDSRRMAQRLLDAGCKVELFIESGMWHVYPIYGIAEAREALEKIARFLRRMTTETINEA